SGHPACLAASACPSTARTSRWKKCPSPKAPPSANSPRKTCCRSWSLPQAGWPHAETTMIPSQTVENYLKTIHLTEAANRAHAQAPAGERALVPMGQLATALGVVPGTATTMVKALEKSG